MTAPKIDTQAPDTIWADQDELTWVEADPDEFMRSWETAYVRADLSAAREAAAWIAGRDRSADEVDVWNISGDEIRAMIPPADASAALDRLIAERVRVAVEAERTRISDEITRKRMLLHQQLEVLDISRQDAVYQIRVEVARGSKEGRDASTKAD